MVWGETSCFAEDPGNLDGALAWDGETEGRGWEQVFPRLKERRLWFRKAPEDKAVSTTHLLNQKIRDFYEIRGGFMCSESLFF